MSRFLFFIVLLLLFCGCTKLETRKGQITEPGICLTFDDNYVDEWVKILPLLDSFNAKATFYISYYNRFTSTEKSFLREIQNHGHEIAFHGTNHYNMKEFLKNGSMEMLLKTEIKAGLEKMNADGYYPRTFAYPYGQHNPALDNELLKRFKSVRALNGTPNMARSLATIYGNKIIYGLGIDESSNRPLKDIFQLISNAKTNKACLVLVAHHVDNTASKMHIKTITLRRLLKVATREELAFYTVSQISN